MRSWKLLRNGVGDDCCGSGPDSNSCCRLTAVSRVHVGGKKRGGACSPIALCWKWFRRSYGSGAVFCVDFPMGLLRCSQRLQEWER